MVIANTPLEREKDPVKRLRGAQAKRDGEYLELHISERTARRYNRYFLCRVAELTGMVKFPAICSATKK